MKKFASLLLVLALCMGLSVNAFAAEYSSQTFTSQYAPLDVTTVTIDKVSGSQYDACIPVGATVTVTAGAGMIHNGCILCLSKLDMLESGPTVVHWTYDPSTATMVRTDSFEVIGHPGCAELTPGQTYSFVVTQEMADSFAIFKGSENPYITLETGIDLDAGHGITVQFTFGTDAPAQPEQPTVPAAPAFADVQDGAYYADAVKWAVEKNITTGTTATTFSPDVTCTTAHILTFMWRAAGSPEPASAPFANLTGDEYYAKAAAWAYEKGMVSGTTFDADLPCTRAATMEYFWKQAGSPAAAVTDKFTDVDAASSYAQAVAWAVERGVTTGTSASTFSPDTICTRGQIVTFLHRALG